MKRRFERQHYLPAGKAVGAKNMDHAQAVEEMAAERYLLNELGADAREAFEEHMFDCPECALDIRAGAAFVDEAKTQLPELAAEPLRSSVPAASREETGRKGFFHWWRPAFALPVFAALLLVIGYQNLVTYPALRTSAEQPQLAQVVAVRGATRGGEPIAVSADSAHGIALPIRLEREPGMPAFTAYAFQLSDPGQKIVWTSTASAPEADGGAESGLSLDIPGRMLRDGTFVLAVSGVGANGERTPLERVAFNVHMTH